MIQITADNEEIEIEWLTFSDGAITCKVINCPIDLEYISLSVDTTTPCNQVLEEINLVLNALGELDVNYSRIHLYIPYLPYARGDRVFEKGNPNPLAVFMQRLMSLEFDSITVCDIHNKSATDIYHSPKLTEKTQLNCFKDSVIRWDFNPKRGRVWDYVIAPDKGSKNKVKTTANWLGIPVIQADKKRDLTTGRIIETALSDELQEGSRVIIVDDIMDGGGTFIPLAQKLRDQGCTVDLYVTHLIASKGLDLFKGLIDNIYCYHTVGKFTNRTDVMNFNLNK